MKRKPMNCARTTTPDDSSASAALRGRSVHKISLHQVLIGAVRRHGQEAAADDARPEGEGLRGVEREIEDAELAVRVAERHRRGEAAGDVAAISTTAAASAPAM